jgi:hypothetical protein
MGQQQSNLTSSDNNKQPSTSGLSKSSKDSRSLSQSASQSDQQKMNTNKNIGDRKDASKTVAKPIKIPISNGNTLLAQWKVPFL